MKWKYRTHHYKYYYTEKEIDFTTGHLNYEQFLLQEFFTANIDEKTKLLNYYRDLHGSRSHAYIVGKYSEWANGNFHLTDMMKERIVAIMPKFLNNTARHKLGIYEFMSSIKNTVKSFQLEAIKPYERVGKSDCPDNIIALFDEEYKKIENISIRYFRFNVLTNDEKVEALKISQYILSVKLQSAFNKIKKDIETFLPFLPIFILNKFSANYSAISVNINIDLSNKKFIDFNTNQLKALEIETNSQYRKYADKYMAYELLTIHKEAKKAAIDGLLNKTDIELFLAYHNDLKNGKNEATMKSILHGEGGILNLHVQIIPPKLSRIIIFKTLVGIVSAGVIFSFALALILKYHKNGLAVLACLYIEFMITSFIIQEIKK